MPLLRIIADAAQVRPFNGDEGLNAALGRSLALSGGPITVLIHGYKYQPGHRHHCPFDHILGLRASRRKGRVVSWPHRLGLRGQPGEPLAIGFGWQARGSLHSAYHRAEQAGAALGHLLALLARLAPHRPVRLLAHSLGARVALQALRHAPAGVAQRAILMVGAETCESAAICLEAPGAAGCEILNVTSRENDLFDSLFERLIPQARRLGGTLGCAPSGWANWTNLQLDDPGALAALRCAGFPVAPPQRRVCHWSPYLRPGVFPLYRAFLDGQITLPELAAILPAQTQPRWARLAPQLGHLLPALRKQPLG